MDVDFQPLDQLNGTLPTAAACWAEVDQLLMFRDFAAAPQLRNFLRYIVEETLAQRGDQLKERNIAVHALMRSPDFDPRLDSVVRVMAGKLRRALECYYHGSAGAAAQVRIEVPRGAYRPLFRRIEPSRWEQITGRHETDLSISAPRTNGGHAAQRLVLAVLPLLPLTKGSAEQALAEALGCEICVQLRKFRWLKVLDYLLTRRCNWAGAGDEELPDCDYVIVGTCRRQAKQVRVTVELSQVSDGHLLWADQFDLLAAAASFTAEDAIVTHICAAISQSLQTAVPTDNLPPAQGSSAITVLKTSGPRRRGTIRPLAIVTVKKPVKTPAETSDAGAGNRSTHSHRSIRSVNG
jgi:TolB-like protein